LIEQLMLDVTIGFRAAMPVAGAQFSKLCQLIMTRLNDPAAVVQRQLDAFNARDLDALLATYAEDAEMFEHPSKLLASGSAAFRERYTARFQEANLHATLLSRTVMGHIVVDHEEVSRNLSRRRGQDQADDDLRGQAGQDC
jgi:hypothetical protein